MTYSIITVNLNNALGLKDTIESVFKQTCHDYEFIVIDGNSTDKSKSIIEQYKDKIDYWVSEPDSGIFNAMNKGIKVSKGNYLIFMNSGDSFYDESVLENSIKYLGADFIIGNIMRKEDNSIMNYDLSNISMRTFYNGAIPHQATFHKRSLFQDCQYDECLKISSDWKFFFQKIILENASYTLMPIVVSLFDTNGISNRSIDVANKERTQIIRDYLPARIVMDYELFKDKQCEMLYLIPQFKYTRTLKRIITYFTKMVLYLNRNINIKNKWINKSIQSTS